MHEKGRLTKTIRRRYSGQQPGTKSGRRPADKPRIDRLSTAGFVPPSVYIGVSFVRASRDTPRRAVFDCLVGKRVGCRLGEPTCPRPAPPSRRAPPRRAPPRPWYVRVLDSTGVRVLDSTGNASGKLSRKPVFGVIWGSNGEVACPSGASWSRLLRARPQQRQRRLSWVVGGSNGEVVWSSGESGSCLWDARALEPSGLIRLGPARVSRMVVFGCLWVGTTGRTVVGRINGPLVGRPSAGMSKEVVSGNLAVGRGGCVVVGGSGSQPLGIRVWDSTGVTNHKNPLLPPKLPSLFVLAARSTT